MADPKPGEMILYDYARPPLLDGSYRMQVATDVTVGGSTVPLESKDAFFNVEGPRFTLAPNEVSAVFPPRNGHGAFHDALPHVALGRRTLPWERALGDSFTVGPNDVPYPFLALVLFQEGEYELKRNLPLEQVVSTSVFNRLGRPQGIRCDAVEASTALLRSLLPMPDELRLLTHVRQVNVEDRELAAGDSDGYFAVVMSNRLPQPGTKHRACLVSVEERTDLLPTTDDPRFDVGGVLGGVLEGGVLEAGTPPAPGGASTLGTSVLAANGGSMLASAMDEVWAGRSSFLGGVRANVGDLEVVTVDLNADDPVPEINRLVLLFSWSFECEGDGTFRELMQHLNVGMIGQVAEDSKLTVTDTGHIQIGVTDRDGAPERAWYRGPLVNAPLSRDTNGPYHCADQARRVAADTGAEDVSYAAAFEVGRLLAAADARLAQELMRWRRGAYRQASRSDSIQLIQAQMTLVDAVDLHLPLAALIATSAVARLAQGAGPLADPFTLSAIEQSPLLRADAVRDAFGLETVAQANVLLGRTTGVLSAPVTITAPAAAHLETLDAVLRDSVGVRRLTDARAKLLDNTKLAVRTPSRGRTS